MCISVSSLLVLMLAAVMILYRVIAGVPDLLFGWLRWPVWLLGGPCILLLAWFMGDD